MSKYQAYPEYKDSGVEWLGQIPSDWQITKLKHIASIFGRIGFRGYTVNDIVNEGEGSIVLSPSNIFDGKFSLSKVSYLSWDKYYESPEIMVERNDILLVKTGSTYGKSSIIKNVIEPMTINPQMALIKKTKINPSFLAYWLSSELIKAKIEISNTGSGMPTMTQENINEFPITLPNKNYAEKIAAFLDHETAKIDTLIEKQQQLIGLLKEKRQAVISHAVTKGLNPDVPMKDSGVEWLGEVPEHWNVLRLSRVGKVGQGCSFSHSIQGQTKGDIPWYKIMDMNTDGNEEYMNKSSNYINKKLASRIGAPIFPKGSIIFPRVGAALLTNKRRILSVDSIVDDNIYTFVSRKVKHRFAYRLLQLINMETLCSPGLVPTITFSAINNIYIPLPSLAEQDNIIEYIDHKLSHIDLLIDKTNNAIKLSQERRTALISAAVTGKIDVRHFTLEDGVAPTTSSDTNEAAQEAIA